MKIKNKMKIAAIVLAGGTLAACGQSPKEQYISLMAKASEAESGKLEMSIKDFAVSGDSQTQAFANMMKNQLNDIKLTSNYSMPDDGKEYSVDLNVDALGQKIKFEMLGNQENAYLSTDYVASMMDLVNQFSGGQAVIDDKKLKEIEGKYIDLKAVAESEDASKVTGTEKLEDLDLKTAVKYQKDLQKEFVKYLEDDVDDKRFTEKEGKLSFTIKKKDLEKLNDIQEELAKKNKDYKQYTSDFATTLKDLDKLDIKTVIDEKTNKQTYDIDIESKKNNIDSYKFHIVNIPSDKTKDVKMPSKDQLVSEKQLNEMMDSATGTTSLDATAVKWTDAEFNQVMDIVKQNAGSYSDAQRQQILEQYKVYMTDEQYKEMEKELSK
ncbi:hypothetical protein [Bacillus sp. REN10]|uniref:hypothetical protein n=1 Tax=Bacillus sp. REN10 TaxID=2782541 RepID=UPI00193BE562|nr:hypothetical protein [Bacillus sp. REN10]